MRTVSTAAATDRCGRALVAAASTHPVCIGYDRSVRTAFAAVVLAACGRIGFGGPNGVGLDGDGSTDGDGGNELLPDVVVPTLCPNATLIGKGIDPHLAWNGDAWGVTFRDGMVQRFARLAANGAPAPSILVNDGTGTNLGGPAAIREQAAGWLIGYASDGVHVQEIGSDGALVGARTTIDVAVPARYPSFDNGSGALRLTWLSYQAGALVVTTSQLSGTYMPINTTQLTSSQSTSVNARSTWNGTSWSVYWDGVRSRAGCTAHSLYARTVNADGTAASGQNAEPIEFDCNASMGLEHHRPQAVWTGTDYLVFWDPHAGAGTTAIESARMSTAHVLTTAPGRVTTSPVSTHADVLANGGEIGVAWSGNGIHVTRLDTNGGALGELTFDSSGVTPSLDWDGSRYAVAYEKAGDIYFAAACP